MKGFFSYVAPEPLAAPPAVLKGWTQADWDTLSPGMKREIERSYAQSNLSR